MALLEVQDIHTYYGDAYVIQGLSLTLEQGLSQTLREGAFQALSLLVSAIVLVILNPLLAVIVLLGAPLIAGVYRAMAKGAQRRSIAVQEQLGSVLAIASENYSAQSVVMVMGDGQCNVKDCIAALKDDYGTPLSLVTLSDPSMVMKMAQANGQQQTPSISISGSVVRGNGQFLTVRVSRPFELRAEDSLIALTGSFLLMEGNPKDAMARGTADITLNHLTTYLTDQLFLLRAIKESGMNLKGLVNTQVHSAADCIFASATGKPLIHLDGVDSEEQMKRYFSWQESKHNAFSHVTTYLDQVPAATNEMAPPAYNEDAWKTFTRDVNGLFALVRFQNAPGPDAPMWKVIPADFKTRADSNLAGCGANIERLPKPSDENDTAGRANAFPDD